MARRWRRIARQHADQAHELADWADFIEPEASSVKAPAQKVSNRKSDPAEILTIATRIHEALEERWPELTIAKRIKCFAEEIGWSPSRAKDVYYADHRVALRAFEQVELDIWLSRPS